MSDDDQAEADLHDDATGDDLASQGASHDPDNNGATDPVKAYEAEVAAILERGDQPDDESDDLADDADSGNGEEEESQEEETEGEESSEEESDEEDSPEEEEDPASDEDEGKPQSRFRIRAADDVEAEALALRKRHPEWSLKECLAKAEQVLGVATKDDAGHDEDSAPARTSEIVAQEIESLLDEKEAALKAMEFEKVAELDRKFRALTKEESALLTAEANAAASKQDSEAARFDSEWDQSEARAIAHYPDCTDKESPLTKRMNEIDARMKRLEDPLFSSPNKPFLLAQAAARELGIPMTDPKAQKPATKKAITRRPVAPASGNARTTEPVDSATKLEKRIGGVQSMEDYESVVASLTGG